MSLLIRQLERIKIQLIEILINSFSVILQKKELYKN